MFVTHIVPDSKEHKSSHDRVLLGGSLIGFSTKTGQKEQPKGLENVAGHEGVSTASEP
jgi:hypothetical protein